MPNTYMPFVAIIGGIQGLSGLVKDEARTFGQELGAELAGAGMGLVTYFSDDASLEPHVVSGYVNALPAIVGAARIRVRFAESQRGQVRFAEQTTRPEVFEVKLFPGLDWEAPFYRSLVHADGVDAVMLMAGKTSTLIAGQIALARPLPLLAVDKFEGSAKVIRTELAMGDENYPSSLTHTPAQAVAWLRNKCLERENHRLERAKQQEEISLRELRYVNVMSQKRKAIWAAISLAALLVAIIFGMSRISPAVFYSGILCGGLITAGATGALARSIRWGSEQIPPSTSLLLGALAGLVVGLAYLIPFLIGAPGLLEPKAGVVEANSKIQFLSAVLIAISAGVGFDSVFTRLRKEALDHPTGPSARKSS